MSDTLIQEKQKLSRKTLRDEHRIVLYNDDYNTFDHVIEVLIDVCEHDLIQAEQCAMITHYNGKCEVKTGPRMELIPKCREMLNRGLTAEVQ